MIACDINDFGILCYHAGEMADYHQVGFREICFTELPDVNNVTVEDQHFWFNASQVFQKFICVAAECPQVKVGDYDNIDITLSY